MIELYAITDSPSPPEPPLRAVRCGGLTALVGPAAIREVTPDVLWRHEDVVEGLMAKRDVLPVRFGTVMRDDEAAARALDERRTELERALERVRGAVELSVRALGRDAEPETPRAVASGREYMREKGRRVEIARLLHEPLAALARDSLVQPGAELLHAAYLVERPAVEAFVSLVKTLETRHAVNVLCTGPWPPYSFVEGGTET